MKNLLKEYIRSIVLQEFRSGFRINDFKKLATQKERLKYAEEYLPLLGEGTSRITYALPNTKYVLKLAMNKAGTAQNEAEVDFITGATVKELVADIYDFDTNYYWLISETVKSFKSDDDVIAAVGLRDYRDFELRTFIYTAHQTAKKPDNVPLKSNPKYEALMASPWMKKLVELFAKSKSVIWEDLASYDHWGITGSGRIVILDYGFTEDVWNTHYKRGGQADSFNNF